MKYLTLILLLVSSSVFAQKLQPTIGVHWTGGLSYSMEQELPSGQIGIVYTPKTPDLIMSNIGVNANYYIDFISEVPNNYHTYYVLRLQFAKEFVQYWNVTYYVGYVNDFHNNLMSHYTGPFKSNIAFGVGLQITDDLMTGEIMYENLGLYPQLSVGVNFNLGNILKKRTTTNKIH